MKRAEGTPPPKQPQAAEAADAVAEKRAREEQQQQQQQTATTAAAAGRPHPPAGPESAARRQSISADHHVTKGTPTEPLPEPTAGNPLEEDEHEAAGYSVPKAAHVVVEEQSASTEAGSKGLEDTDPQKTDGEGAAWRARRRKQFSPKKRVSLADYVLPQSYEEWTALPETSSGSPHESPDCKKAGSDSVGRTRRRKQQQPKKWVSLARLGHHHQHNQHVCCLHGPGRSSQAGAESQLPATSCTLPGDPRDRSYTEMYCSKKMGKRRYKRHTSRKRLRISLNSLIAEQSQSESSATPVSPEGETGGQASDPQEVPPVGRGYRCNVAAVGGAPRHTAHARQRAAVAGSAAGGSPQVRLPAAAASRSQEADLPEQLVPQVESPLESGPAEHTPGHLAEDQQLPQLSGCDPAHFSSDLATRRHHSREQTRRQQRLPLPPDPLPSPFLSNLFEIAFDLSPLLERGQPTARQEVGGMAEQEQLQLLQNPPAARLAPPFARQVPVAPLEPPPPPPPANRAAARKHSDVPAQSLYRSPGFTQASPPGLRMFDERSLLQILGIEERGTGVNGVHGRGGPLPTRGLTFAAGKISREVWGSRPVQGYLDPEALADALAPPFGSRSPAAAAAGRSPGGGGGSSPSAREPRMPWRARSGSLFPLRGFFDPEALADALKPSDQTTGAASHPPGDASSPANREQREAPPQQGFLDPAALADALEQSPESGEAGESGGSSRRTTGAGGGPPARRAV
ncbi:trithorax group protein osa-like [Schistocerca gregaria]|uniref:trithorax group protein osa-like n=1 Tax=Schistocerca gregaria TaxID=7010 RepID=UPI00211EBA67|nr:trithorax group protein osa-like [Schistocerca gregaria]